MATYGFIGAGNMGGALARAVCRTAEPDEVFLANRTPEKAEALARFGAFFAGKLWEGYGRSASA